MLWFIGALVAVLGLIAFAALFFFMFGVTCWAIPALCA